MDLNAPAPWWIYPVPLVLAASIVGLWLGLEWWLNCRAQRNWDRGEAERQHRFAEDDRQQALQQQLRELEQAIREETLPDWQREVIRERRQREAEITREARRRLGLPEEEHDG